jgi:hypothetical protein
MYFATGQAFNTKKTGEFWYKESSLKGEILKAAWISEK